MLHESTLFVGGFLQKISDLVFALDASLGSEQLCPWAKSQCFGPPLVCAAHHVVIVHIDRELVHRRKRVVAVADQQAASKPKPMWTLDDVGLLQTQVAVTSRCMISRVTTNRKAPTASVRLRQHLTPCALTKVSPHWPQMFTIAETSALLAGCPCLFFWELFQLLSHHCSRVAPRWF